MVGVKDGGSMAHEWKAFLDDSGDARKQKFLVVGSVLGDKAAWNDFNKAWRRTLHEPPRIEHFHYKEFISLRGEFNQFRDGVRWPKPAGSVAANCKKDALERVILKSNLQSYGVVLDLAGYKRVREMGANAKLFLGTDAWGYALQEVAHEIAKLIIEADPNAKVTYISDDSSSAPTYAKAYVGFKKKNPNTAKHMLGLSHLPDEQWYGLQAADLIASAVKKCYEEMEKDASPKAFQSLVKERPLFKNFVKIGYIDEGRLRGIIAHQSITRRGQ
jgi:hypothetical protein